MKFELEQKDLLRLLTLASVRSSSTNVLVQQLTVTIKDGKAVCQHATMDSTGFVVLNWNNFINIKGDGQFTIMSKKAYDIVNRLEEGKIKISVSADSIEFASPNKRGSIPLLPNPESVKDPKVPDDYGMTAKISSSDLKSLVKDMDILNGNGVVFTAEESKLTAKVSDKDNKTSMDSKLTAILTWQTPPIAPVVVAVAVSIPEMSAVLEGDVVIELKVGSPMKIHQTDEKFSLMYMIAPLQNMDKD